MSGSINRGLACLVLIPLWLAMPASAEDDYLSVLEAEADETGGRSTAETATEVDRPAKKVRTVQDNQAIQPALGFEEFEAELNANFSGTWFLYEKLTRGQRKAVYHAYQEDNRTSIVREMIVKLLSSS